MTEIQREEVYEWLQDFLYGLSDFSKNNDDYLYAMYDDEAYFISYIIISKIFDIVKPDRIETYRNTLIEIKEMISAMCGNDRQFNNLYFMFINREITSISYRISTDSFNNKIHISFKDNDYIDEDYKEIREKLFSMLFSVCGNILEESDREQDSNSICYFIHDIGECFYNLDFDLMHDTDYEYFSVEYGESLAISFNNKFPEKETYYISNIDSNNRYYIEEGIAKQISIDKEENSWYNEHVHEAKSNTIIKGEDKMKNIQLTLGGKLAVKRSNGDYVFMNSEGKMENVGKSVFDTLIVPMEVAKSELAVGDIIDRGNELMFVKKINDDSVDVVNLENKVEQLVEEVSGNGAVPMFTKMVSPLDSKSIENETVRMSLLSKSGDSVALMQMLSNKEQSDRIDKLAQSIDTLAQAMTVIVQGLAKKD